MAENTPEMLAMARRYESGERGLFCRHCGRSSFRHIPTPLRLGGGLRCAPIAQSLRNMEHFKHG